jgi:protein-S-isoprenylcysteine O-methyltransferase Ste14
VNLLMFIFISIPMEERHFKDYKPDYEQYKKETHMLLILPKKK